MRNGDNGAEQEEEERGNKRAHTQLCKWASTEGAREAANEERQKLQSLTQQHVPFHKRTRASASNVDLWPFWV